MLCGCKFQFRHVFEPTFTAYGVFFCAINPAKSVRRYNSNKHLHYSAVNSWLTIPTLPQSDDNLGKVEAISVLNARDMGMGMPKTRGCPKRCDTGSRETGNLVDGFEGRRYWDTLCLIHTVLSARCSSRVHLRKQSKIGYNTMGNVVIEGNS